MIAVRSATPTDTARLGELAAGLVRFHHELDPDRFLPGEDVERGYGGWLAREAKRREAVVLVAALGDAVMGYAYGTLEGRNWNDLLDAHGKVHDVFVDPTWRRKGVARQLVVALRDALLGMGAPRVVLATAARNEAAQRLFESLGFRPSMIEMTFSP